MSEPPALPQKELISTLQERWDQVCVRVGVGVGGGETAVLIATTLLLISGFEFPIAQPVAQARRGGGALKEFVEKALLAPGRHRCLPQEDTEGWAPLGRALTGHSPRGLKVQVVLESR